MDWLILIAILVTAYLAHIIPEPVLFPAIWYAMFCGMIAGYLLLWWTCGRTRRG